MKLLVDYANKKSTSIRYKWYNSNDTILDLNKKLGWTIQ